MTKAVRVHKVGGPEALVTRRWTCLLRHREKFASASMPLA